MSDIKITKDMNVVDVMVAQAKGERVDSEVLQKSHELIRE